MLTLLGIVAGFAVGSVWLPVTIPVAAPAIPLLVVAAIVPRWLPTP